MGVEKAGDVARERAVRDGKLSGIDGDTYIRNVFRVGSKLGPSAISAERPEYPMFVSFWHFSAAPTAPANVRS